MIAPFSTQVLAAIAPTFQTAIEHLALAGHPDIVRMVPEVAEIHHRAFEDAYAMHRQDVIARRAQFQAFASREFDRRVIEFSRCAKAAGPKGISNRQVEKIIGCSVELFNAYCSHFRIDATTALIYVGNHRFLAVPFRPNVARIQ